MSKTFFFLVLVCSFGICFIPESPYWLSVFKNDTIASALALKKIYSNKLLAEEAYKRVLESKSHSSRSKGNIDEKSKLIQIKENLNIYKEPIVWKPFLILFILFVFQQLSGSYVIIFYAVEIFREIGGNFKNSIDGFSALLLLGTIRFFIAVLSAFISKKVGRRKLMFISGCGMIMTSFGCALCLYFSQTSNQNLVTNQPEHVNVTTPPLILLKQNYIPRNLTSLDVENENLESRSFSHVTPRETRSTLILQSNVEERLQETIEKQSLLSESQENNNLMLYLVLGYVSFSSFGYLVIPWTLIGELLPVQVRGKLGGVMVSLAYILMFIVVKIFPFLQETVSWISLFLYLGALNILGVVFLYVWLPETLGKTFEEIAKGFEQKHKEQR